MLDFKIFGLETAVQIERHKRQLCMLFALSFLQPLHAEQNSDLVCADIADSMQRLACYDQMQVNAGVRDVSESTRSRSGARSYLTRSWDLDYRDDELLGENQSPLRPHKVSYLITRNSSEPNAQPSSPTHAAAVASTDIDLNEIKFQISQKAKVLNPVHINFLGFTGFRLWGAYTQQSSWQAFNAGNSSPFRETNYEPEVILALNTGNADGLKLINAGYVHQSNGRDQIYSRSWNRMYLQGAWETGNLTVLGKVWWRVPEDYATDDNPDIVEYVGRGELNLRWESQDSSQIVELTLRNNFRLGENRGLMQLDWAAPLTVSQSTKLHIQLTSGYGESLIDYNHHQTTFGLGVSFRDW